MKKFLEIFQYIANPRGAIYIAIASILMVPVSPYAFFADSNLEVFLLLAAAQDFFIRTARLVFKVYEYHPAGGITSIGYILLNPGRSMLAWFHPFYGGQVFMVPIWVGCIAVHVFYRLGVF